jgi:hypothetical protein
VKERLEDRLRPGSVSTLSSRAPSRYPPAGGASFVFAQASRGVMSIVHLPTCPQCKSPPQLTRVCVRETTRYRVFECVRCHAELMWTPGSSGTRKWPARKGCLSIGFEGVTQPNHRADDRLASAQPRPNVHQRCPKVGTATSSAALSTAWWCSSSTRRRMTPSLRMLPSVFGSIGWSIGLHRQSLRANAPGRVVAAVDVGEHLPADDVALSARQAAGRLRGSSL